MYIVRVPLDLTSDGCSLPRGCKHREVVDQQNAPWIDEYATSDVNARSVNMQCFCIYKCNALSLKMKHLLKWLVKIVKAMYIRLNKDFPAQCVGIIYIQ